MVSGNHAQLGVLRSTMPRIYQSLLTLCLRAWWRIGPTWCCHE